VHQRPKRAERRLRPKPAFGVLVDDVQGICADRIGADYLQMPWTSVACRYFSVQILIPGAGISHGCLETFFERQSRKRLVRRDFAADTTA